MLRFLPLWVCVALIFILSILLAPAASLGEDGEPDPVAQVQAVEQAFKQVIKQVSPSVVGIRAKRRYAAVLPGSDHDRDAGLFEQVVVVNASGTVIGRDGLILTNEHVIQSASEIEVLFFDGQSQPAAIVAADPRADLAILRVARQPLVPAKLCDWSTVARGEWTIAMGNPYGLGDDGQLCASVGVISNLDRRLPGLGEVDDRLYHDMIQTTAAINPGNSGGPLFNIRGELLGIITAMHTRTAVDEGIGFAIPLSPTRRRIIDQLAAGRSVEYGYLGLTVRKLADVERQKAGVAERIGVLVERVEAGGPAAGADIRVGDYILRYDDQIIRGPAHLAEQVGATTVGARVPIELYRDGRSLNVSVVVEHRNVNRVSWMRGDAFEWRGMRLANLSDDSRKRMHVDNDATGVVVVDVLNQSAGDQARIQIGDVIQRVGDQPVEDLTGFRRYVADHAGPIALKLHKRGTLTVSP